MEVWRALYGVQNRTLKVCKSAFLIRSLCQQLSKRNALLKVKPKVGVELAAEEKRRATPSSFVDRNLKVCRMNCLKHSKDPLHILYS